VCRSQALRHGASSDRFCCVVKMGAGMGDQLTLPRRRNEAARRSLQDHFANLVSGSPLATLVSGSRA
jgi:hypothetical protein